MKLQCVGPVLQVFLKITYAVKACWGVYLPVDEEVGVVESARGGVACASSGRVVHSKHYRDSHADTHRPAAADHQECTRVFVRSRVLHRLRHCQVPAARQNKYLYIRDLWPNLFNIKPKILLRWVNKFYFPLLSCEIWAISLCNIAKGWICKNFECSNIVFALGKKISDERKHH